MTKAPEAKRENALCQTQKAQYSQSINLPVDPILSLQSAIGNQVMQRLLQADLIQAKLKIGQPDDKYEQEADRVADQVMRMSEPGIQRTPT